MKVSSRIVLTGVLGALSAAIAVTAQAWADSSRPKVIDLTQVGCQFIESEAKNHGFDPRKAEDCKAINERTGRERLGNAKPLTLEPGTYVFRVANKTVPYELGFWLRSKGYDWKNPLHKLTKTSVSGGGLTQGTSKDYEVTLKPGEYVYSCPLNPTPDYRLIVTGG
ncbi:MAG: hypothetical protein RIB59_14900 [Rhodospirillales bacterium]